MFKIHSYTIFVSMKSYLLITEPHLSPGISTDVHATQEHSVLALQADRRRTVVTMDTRLLRRNASTQLRLNGVVVLFVDDVIYRVAVYEKVFLYYSQDITTLNHNCWRLAFQYNRLPLSVPNIRLHYLKCKAVYRFAWASSGNRIRPEIENGFCL